MGEDLSPTFVCIISKDHFISQNVTSTYFKRFTSRLIQGLPSSDLTCKQAQMNLSVKLVWYGLSRSGSLNLEKLIYLFKPS